MRAKSITRDEQYRLIMECRSSGLSDHQWCIEHGIKPGTFYNWVKRIRKQGSMELPPPTGQSTYRNPKQEVVKVERPTEIIENTADNNPVSFPQNQASSDGHTIELLLPGITVRVQNDADPGLLELTLRCLRRIPC